VILRLDQEDCILGRGLTFIVSKVSNLITKKESSSYKEDKTPIKRVRAERRYSYYSKIRHNS
jgi:hypothetical protein